ncbi:DUF3634 family protein [Vibrio sp. SS-MA-C1-2]|uniref:DUF3634 family protein n=1 Tax=Vibrio sp. SS-MA-C1-2 TaxID=2908646 RepID=UPI001F1F149E|nr:DUF3634 family protein [Vibrio sp. SS-MA-C1-2]UJF18100.1 DUF3634 family protein [Vibrio sp. SS-MA-C1-2]
MIYVILLAAVLLIIFFSIDRPIVKLIFKDGKLIKVKGKIAKGFIHDCQDIGLRKPFTGVIKVYKNRFTTKLNFSKSIPKNIQQRIRNAFPYPSSNNKKHNKKRV